VANRDCQRLSLPDEVDATASHIAKVGAAVSDEDKVATYDRVCAAFKVSLAAAAVRYGACVAVLCVSNGDGGRRKKIGPG
jgi:hypothetical protein